MSLNNISEDHIERFVRFPDTLSTRQKEAITNELVKNPELKALALWLAEFYDEVDAISTNNSSKFLVRLTPIEFKKPAGSKSFRILAAMASATKSKGLETVATLASEENGTVARVLRNNSDKRYKLHLIRSKEAEDGERTIFTIEPLNMDLVIGESRRLIFETSPELDELNWEDAHCSLREPLLSVNLTSSDLMDKIGSKKLSENSRDLTIWYDSNDQSLIIEEIVPDDCQNPLSRVLIKSDDIGETLYRMNTEGETRIPLPEAKDLDLKLFI